MSADTGAVDAVEQAVIAQNEYFKKVWAKKQAYSADEVACGAMQAAIQAFQRANAERLTALLTEYDYAFEAWHSEVLGIDYDDPHDKELKEAHDELQQKRAAFLLQFVGPSEVQK